MNRRFGTRSFMLLSYSFVLIFSSAQADEMSVSKSLGEVVLKYEEYLSSILPISFESGFRPEGAVADNTSIALKYDGSCLYLSHRDLGSNQMTETVNSFSYGCYYRTSYTSEGDAVIFSYHDKEKYPPIQERWGMLGILFGWCHINGQVIYLPDFLRKLEHSSTVRQEGNDYVVSVNSEQYAFEFAFHHEHFYLCRMIVKRTVESPTPYERRGLSFDLHSFKLIEGIYFPEKIECSSSYLGNAASQSTPNLIRESVEYNLRSIHRGKLTASDFMLQSKIKNGTEAVMHDDPQVEHIWYDGEIVPKTSELMMEIAMEDHMFMHGPDETRFWMLAIGILLIVLGLGKMLYDIIRKSKKEGT